MDWLLAGLGIAFGVGITTVLYLVPREWLPMSAKWVLAAVAEISLLYGLAVVVFWEVTTMRLPLWPSVIVGSVIGGLLAAFAVGMAWKHVDSLSRAEAQPPKSESPKPPVAPAPPVSPARPADPKSTPPPNTMNAPGGMNFKDSTVINPTIHNYAAPKPWGLDASQLAILSQRVAPYADGRDRGSDLITSVFGDSDSGKFAVGLVGAFREANWRLSGTGFSQAQFGDNLEGIIIKVNPDIPKNTKTNPPGLQEFYEILKSAGLNPDVNLDPSVPKGDFRIIIGRQPRSAESPPAQQDKRPRLKLVRAYVEPIRSGRVESPLKFTFVFKNQGDASTGDVESRLVLTDMTLKTPPVKDERGGSANGVSVGEEIKLVFEPIEVQNVSMPPQLIACILRYQKDGAAKSEYKDVFFFTWGGSDNKGVLSEYVTNATPAQRDAMTRYLAQRGLGDIPPR